MNTPNIPGKTPEEHKKQNGTPVPDLASQHPGTENEKSHRVTPANPEATPKDTVRDAKDRWDTESPAVKGHPQRSVPEEDLGKKDTENPNEEEEELLKKRDETGIA